MNAVVASALTDYPKGSTESQPVQFSGECFGLAVMCDSTQHTDPAITATIEAWISTDGGQTWNLEGSISSPGGPQADRDGQPIAAPVLGFYSARKLSAQIDGKWFDNVAPFVDPLVKTVLRIEGGTLKTQIAPVVIKPRTDPLTESHRSIAVVQSKAVYGSTAGGSVTITTGAITSTAGNLLIANLSYYENGGAGFSSFTDSNTDTWPGTLNTWTTKVARYPAANATNIECRYVENCNAGSNHKFRLVTAALGLDPGLVVIEVSGYASGAPDQSVTATTASSTSHATGATGTTAQANELLIAYCSGGTTFTETYTSAGGSWITQNNQTNVAGLTMGGICESQAVTSGPATYSWTGTSSGAMYSAQMLTTWKEAAGVTGSLFRQSNLNGLQTGGPFFVNPIG